MLRRAVLAVALAAVTGCAGAAPSPGEPSAFDEDDDVPMAGAARRGAPPPARAGETEPEAAPEPAPPPPVIPTESAGVIPRALLVEVLDRGPGQFLVGIEIEATFEGKQFAGWQIVRFEPADARLAGAPLAPGDVVTAVNTRAIKRPRHLQAVWDELRRANALVIEGRRAGRAFALRYDIGP